MTPRVGIAVLIIVIIVPLAQPYIYRGYDRSSDPSFDMFGRSIAGDNAYRQPLRSPAPMVRRAMPPQRPMPPQGPMYAPPRVPMRVPMRPPVIQGAIQTQPIMHQPIAYHHHPHYDPGYDPPSYDPPDISRPDPPSEYYHRRPRVNLGIYNPSRINAFNRAYLY